MLVSQSAATVATFLSFLFVKSTALNKVVNGHYIYFYNYVYQVGDSKTNILKEGTYSYSGPFLTSEHNFDYGAFRLTTEVELDFNTYKHKYGIAGCKKCGILSVERKPYSNSIIYFYTPVDEVPQECNHSIISLTIKDLTLDKYIVSKKIPLSTMSKKINGMVCMGEQTSEPPIIVQSMPDIALLHEIPF